MASSKERLGCTLVVLGAAVVLVLFVIAVSRSMQPDRPAPSASASAGAVIEAPGTHALLGGIGVGDAVAGWRIDNTRIVEGKRMKVSVQRGKTGFDVWIARKGTGKRLAPRQTDKYDFYVGGARTYGGPVPEGAENKVMDALVERVKRTENKAPVPPGL